MQFNTDGRTGRWAGSGGALPHAVWAARAELTAAAAASGAWRIACISSVSACMRAELKPPVSQSVLSNELNSL